MDIILGVVMFTLIVLALVLVILSLSLSLYQQVTLQFL